MSIASLTDEQISTLAKDIQSGRVFTNHHLREQDLLECVFMPLGLGALANFTQEEVADIGMIYEYMDKAGPRRINGCPGFLSCQFLNKTDLSRLLEKIKKVETALAGI